MGWAYVADHFKAVGEKHHVSSIRGIDCTYLINLDERPEKYSVVRERLESYGICPHRFSAVNGWRLSLEDINDLGVTFEPWMQGSMWGTYYPLADKGTSLDEIVQMIGRNYFSHCMSPGAIGCVLSHLSVLQDAYDAGYYTIWIMEDDVLIVRDPHLLSERIEELDAAVGKEGWDILFTDTDTIGRDGKRVACAAYARRPNFSPANPHRFAEKTLVTPNLRSIGSRYGSYSMIVRRSGMKKILNFFKRYQIFLPYDMEYTQPNDIHLYTVLDDIVTTQFDAPTDNGFPNYEKILP
jgi:GR25 family glycosyltransferase involved in LPS biosynthesis